MPEPRPTGTVTFLFTDIEGSTQLWEQQHAWMDAAHHRHEAILRDVIAAHGGWAYKQIGDAFQAAFQTAPAALAAAVAAQQALAAEPWDAATPTDSKLTLRVRMALHTGVTEERVDDYLGPLLNRVARLMSAGHGGQILLTAATYELVRDALPAGVELRDLGERRLKDLIRPEQVWQVVGTGLPAEFPPLRTLDARPNNLPRQTTALIGREAETAAVATLLRKSEVALVTLTGPGGTGKTRLALQAAADLLDDFPDGCWFVDLAPLTDPDLLAPAIADALALAPGGDAPVPALQAALQPKALLLVLDNCEQLAAAAPQIGALVSAAPRLKILATSRILLRLYAEHEYPVPPLALPARRPLPPLAQLGQYEAVRLFVERAQAARPDFAITNATAPAVAEICWRLDGLPLAIELAAARVRLLPPEALLARLESRLRLLTGGAQDRPARQQTLRAAIEWSYELLRPAEEQLFRRMAVFLGARSLAAIEAVCAGAVPTDPDRRTGAGDEAPAVAPLASDVLDGVESLIAQSLLRQEAGVGGEPRFVMLETIHEFAREKLQASGEAPALADRHLAYYVALAEEAALALAGPEQATWLDRLAGEYDNVRTALGWARAQGAAQAGLRLAAALERFWLRRRPWSEGRTQLAAMLALAPDAITPARAAALHAAGFLAYRQHDLGAARTLHGESLRIARTLGDTQAIGRALNGLGSTAEEPETQLAYYEESLAIRRAAGDLHGMAGSLGNIGAVYDALGDRDKAWVLYQESIALLREIGDKGWLARTLNSAASPAAARRDIAQAWNLYMETLALARELGDLAEASSALLAMGELARVAGDYVRARALDDEALRACRELADSGWLVAGLSNLALDAYGLGNYPTAKAHLAEALALSEQRPRHWARARLLLSVAQVARGQGEWATTRLRATEAMALSSAPLVVAEAGEACALLGHVALAEGDVGAAVTSFQGSLRLLPAGGYLEAPVIAGALIGLAAIAQASGAPAPAARLLGAAAAAGTREPVVALAPADRAAYARTLTATQATVPVEAFASAFAAGQALSLEEAVALALEEAAPDA